MNSTLRYMMAEIESWESATEFGIPEELWAGYQVRQRSEDLYIAVLSAVFDTLRIEDYEDMQQQLSELAKTLLIYSRSSASKHIGGVDKTTNLLYCAAIFYLAGFPATATLLTRMIERCDGLSEEELFLRGLLSRKLNPDYEFERCLLERLRDSENAGFEQLVTYFRSKKAEGLESDPRLFITAKLTESCLQRFEQFNIWGCLKNNASNFSHDLWKPFLENSKVFPLWELFPSQMEAIKSGILSDRDDTYSMQMPTSSGKTSLCEIIIYNEVKGRNKKVLFLVPFRALASEIKEGISKRLESAGVSVVASHGGNIPTRTEGTSAESADVLIITPEKFTALSQTIPDLESSFDTIICDEGHLIDDSSRGLQYELLLTKLKSNDERARKIIFISAILPNVKDIHSWLGGTEDTLAISSYKPVETDFAFITPNGSGMWELDFNTIYDRPRSYFLSKFLVKDEFKYLNTASERLNLVPGHKSYASLACAASLKARKNGPVALFTTQKNHVASLANRMIKFHELGVGLVTDSFVQSGKLTDLIGYMTFQFGSSYLLPRVLKYGVGFHHGDLPQEIRREMEAAIQNEVINILICTSTLAEGVNLPIRTLVIHTIKRSNGEYAEPIKNRSIKNIVGRVGRAGKETRGRVIISNNGERSVIENVFKEMSMEPARGALFSLIKMISEAVSKYNIRLSNEIFEAQGDDFLSNIDKVDIVLIDLIPADALLQDIDQYIDQILTSTLAYKQCDTDSLKHTITQVFKLRAEHLQNNVPQDQWAALKQSGSSPRYWKFVNQLALTERPEWQTLDAIDDDQWFEEIVLKIVEMPISEIGDDKALIKTVALFWMGGHSYGEIAKSINIEVEAVLKLLGHAIGYHLQDGMAKLTQLAIAHRGEENLSEMARSWAALLQYGLGSLQQLDLFELGASDRLGVWGISRFLENNDIHLRNKHLLRYIRRNAADIILSLEADNRVPKLSLERTCRELKMVSFL